MTLDPNFSTPGTWITVEVNEQGASLAPIAFRRLIIGQRTTGAGTGTDDTVVKVRSADEVGALAARGSMLHRMAIPSFSANRITETWTGILGDDGAGVQATGTIQVLTAATGSGTIALYSGGVRIPAGVTAGDDVNTIAAAINAAYGTALDLPVTAGVLTDTTTLTYVHKGEVGNEYDIRHSYADGEQLPAGVTLAITPMSGGTSNPPLTNLFAAMGDQEFHVIVHPYTDAVSLTAIENELASRADNIRQIPGVAITSASGSVGTLAALGNTRNSEHGGIIAQPGQNPLTPPSEYAAEVAAILADKAALQPNQPWTGLPLNHALAPETADIFDAFDRSDLLSDGIGTGRVNVGKVQGDRWISTYQFNASAAPDRTFRDLTTALTLIHLRFHWRTRWDSKHSRDLLVADGTTVGTGIKIMTPSKARSEGISWARDMEGRGLLQNVSLFAQQIVTAINPSDSTRMDITLPVTMIPPLYQNDTLLTFTLSS